MVTITVHCPHCGRACSSCMQDEHPIYIDVAKQMLGEYGKPRPDRFAVDGLHLNATGYASWASIPKPVIWWTINRLPERKT